MKAIITIICFALTCWSLSAQTSETNWVDEIDRSETFEKISGKVDAYFEKRDANKTRFKNGEESRRDGKYVKFKRWQSFWKHHLTDDGHLADVSKFKKRARNLKDNTPLGPFKDVPWTNVSNEAYLTGQIGMGRTTSIAFHPEDENTFYVGTAIGGVWRSKDGGSTYTPLGDKLPFLAVSSIVINSEKPSILYIAISDHVHYGPPGIGVYKSSDGGLNWKVTALEFTFDQGVQIFHIEADPNNPSIMLVATSQGVYRTTDGFNTVSLVSGINARDVHFKVGSSAIVYLSGRSGEFLKSTDGGVVFNSVIDFGSSATRIITALADDKLVAVQHGDKLHVSTDSGESFPNTTGLPESNMVLAYDPNDANILLGGNFEIYRSNDGGSVFEALTHWRGDNGLPLIHVDQRNVFTNPHNPNEIYWCNDGGLFKYDIKSEKFTDLSNGLIITQFYDIAVSQTNEDVISGGSQDNGSMFRDENSVWREHAPTGDGMNTDIDPLDHSIIYWTYQEGELNRRMNGINTTISPPGQHGNGAWETPFKLDPSDNLRLVVGYEKIYESVDRGNTWEAISEELNAGMDMEQLAIAPSNGKRIYAVSGQNLFVNNAANNTWSTHIIPTSGVISDIEVDFNDMNTVYISMSGYINGEKVLKSTDAGLTWENLSSGIPNVSVTALELYKDAANGIFIGTGVGVFYKDDIINHWVTYGDLPNTSVTDIEIQDNFKIINVGTHGRGVLRASLDIKTCPQDAVDTDKDGICNVIDVCPNLHKDLMGQPCDDSDPMSSGEFYTDQCLCSGGVFNINLCPAEGNTGTTVDWINKVELHQINHQSQKSQYSDFRDVSTQLIAGTTYELKVSLNHVFPLDEIFVWIDYNRDGVLSSQEEISMSTFSAENTSVGSINISTALLTYGVATMRIRAAYNGTNNPCGSMFGEVEDYTVYMLAEDYCLENLVISGALYIEGESITNKVQQEIVIDQTKIMSGASLQLNANSSISMHGETEVETGGILIADPGDCANN